jgi:uncharacterized repeat protein (TIGR03843 family)
VSESEGVPELADGLPPASDQDALELLAEGRLEVVGRLRAASNATLYCQVSLGEVSAACVHKPVAGERPLWDFPDGTLASRERAAYLVSEAMGWRIVPPTVLREGPYGPGMCQLWIEADGDERLIGLVRGHHPPGGWFAVAEALLADDEPAVLIHRDDQRLRRVALFDAVINNADRKGGHLLVTADGHLYGIDHGVTFAVEDKLRTLLWGWADEPLTEAELAALAELAAALEAPPHPLRAALADLLDEAEVAATAARVRELRATGRFPAPAQDRPAVPWPPM